MLKLFLVQTRILPSILLLVFLTTSCDKDFGGNIANSDDIQINENGKLIPSGGGVGLVVASAGSENLNINVHSSESGASRFADVWINSNKGLIRFDVDNLSEPLKDPLRGDVELFNPLIPADEANRPQVFHGGSSNLLSVEWGRWEGDYFLKEVADNDTDQQYDAKTFPLTYIYTDNSTSHAVIDELEARNVSHTYELFYGTVTYLNRRSAGSNEFDIQNEFINGFNQTVINATMEIQFGTGSDSGIKVFTLTTNFRGVTDTINKRPFEAQGSNYRINMDAIPLEMEDCNICYFDVGFGISGHADYFLVGEDAESVICSFEVSNGIQAFYGTLILNRIGAVLTGN